MTRRRALANKAAVTTSSVLAVASVIGFVLVYVLTVRTASGRQFGDASLRGALVTNSTVVDAVDAILGVVSVATLLGGLAAIALIALVRLQRVPGMTAVGLLVAANTSTWLLKNHILTRPDLGLREITPATLNSLPSGHTTAVYSVVVALLVVLPAWARRPVAITGGAAAVVVSLATMSAGWHRAGDSIAAFLVVGAWAGIAGIVTVLAAETARARVPEPRVGDRSWRRWLIAMTFGSAGLGLSLACGLVLIRPLRTSTVGAVTAFVAGGVLVIAAAVAVLLGTLRVLERSDR
ncbi:MAG: phosphatase PAP2 family protein [Actinomycetota bacterium]